MKKKWYQYVGNFLTILALLFLVKKVIDYDLDYDILFQIDNLLWLMACSALYGGHIFLVGFSWKTIITILTGRKIPFSVASDIWCKANLLKYIPGNVFQYIGRNAIVPIMNLKHMDVGLATIIDVSFNIIGVFIIGIICYFPGIQITYDVYFKNNIFIIVGVILLGLLITGLGIFIFRKRLHKFKTKVQKLIAIPNVKKEALCILYYAFWAIYTGIIYVIVLLKIIDMKLDFQDISIVIGAFLLSWIIGFIMPGAPGGIGIREAVLTIILKEQFLLDKILFGIMIYRIVNIFGDLLGLMYAKVFRTIMQKRRKEYEC